MNQADLFNLLKKTVFLIFFCFILFLIFVNAAKYLNYLFEVDRVIKAAMNEKNEIKKINNHFNETEKINTGKYDKDKAYTAVELGYSDYLEDINSSLWGEGINILITGSDKKDFLIKKSRADVIIVMRISKNGKIFSISIPRDTLIKIENNSLLDGKYDKIGHSLYWSNLEGLKNSVENLLGSPIYKTIVIDNFKAFEAFLAIVGGVTIDKTLDNRPSHRLAGWIRRRRSW